MNNIEIAIYTSIEFYSFSQNKVYLIHYWKTRTADYQKSKINNTYERCIKQTENTRRFRCAFLQIPIRKSIAMLSSTIITIEDLNENKIKLTTSFIISLFIRVKKEKKLR